MSISSSSACFSIWLTSVTNCSTRSAVVAAGATETCAGLFRYCFDRSLIELGIVALNSSVCRSLGISDTSLRSAWMNPRSSI